MHSSQSCTKLFLPMMRGNCGRKRGLTREEGKKAIFRVREMISQLNKTYVGKATSSSKWGGARTFNAQKVLRKVRPVEGFLASPPDPPLVRSRNAHNTTPMPATSMPTNSTMSTPLNVPPLHRSDVREPSSPPVARRVGAPATPALRMKHNGQPGVWLSRNAFRRLCTARDQADKKLKVANKRLQRLYKRPPKFLRRTASALLSACGVSARKIPYVLAVTGFYHVGFVPKEHIFSTQTALDDVRAVGAVLRRRIVSKIGGEERCFFIGFDTSARGGSLGSYVISSRAPSERLFWI